MASLIDKTYFVYDINLPDNAYADLNNYLDRYEQEILELALGYDLYALVNAYVNPGSPQRIIDIVEGKSYTEEFDGTNHTVKWNGLVNTEKISIISYYAYVQYLRNFSSFTGQAGEFKPRSENSDNALVNRKVQEAWIRMKALYGFYRQDLLQPSLLNFLTKYEDDYPEWIFTKLGSVNAFDL